jgi:FNIP Repeat
MSGMIDGTDASADILRDRALEVVAKLGWLSKNAYSLSKTVHAFAKPVRVRLTEDAPAAVVRQLLLRAPVVAAQLDGNAAIPLLEILTSDFSGSVAELPGTLQSFAAVDVREGGIAATHSVLQLLPRSLQRFQLSYHHGLVSETHYANPALVMVSYSHSISDLQPVEWNTSLPACLQELYLTQCKFSDELHLPATLRKLELKYCSSSSGGDESFKVHLNEGLQLAVIKHCHCVDISSELPSTLTHLVLQDSSRSTLRLGELPAGLQHLEFSRRLSEPLGLLPSSLRVLKLGYRYSQPLDVLPDTLTELRVGRRFDWPLGILPQSLKSLHIGERFTQKLGPLPPQLEHLEIGKPIVLDMHSVASLSILHCCSVIYTCVIASEMAQQC